MTTEWSKADRKAIQEPTDPGSTTSYDSHLWALASSEKAA